jgi:hypothetical protein
MAILAVRTGINPCDQGDIFHYALTFTGNYVTGGEVINFGAVSGIDGNPVAVICVSTGGFGFVYDLVNLKLLVLGQQPTSATAGVIPLDQIAAAAYPAALTGGVTTATVFFPGIKI